ncbi:MAG: M1 family peptidase, partial [Longimicrobiaceae bacterium]
ATLGDSVFHAAIRTYQRDWLFKHPYPWDFFNTFERVAGRDLDWFWYPWFFTRATFDQAVGAVTPAAGSVSVTVRDLGQVPGPAFIAVTTSAGVVRQTIPVERFLNPSNTRSVTVSIPVQGTVTRVEVDPEQQFPDVNRRNNVWTGS